MTQHMLKGKQWKSITSMNSTQLGQTSDYLELVPCVTMESKANSCYASNTTMRSKKWPQWKAQTFNRKLAAGNLYRSETEAAQIPALRLHTRWKIWVSIEFQEGYIQQGTKMMTFSRNTDFVWRFNQKVHFRKTSVVINITN